MTHLIPANQKSPEQIELDGKLSQLDVLEAEYAQRQLEYSTLAGEIGVFRNRYYLRVGSLYARLDLLRAEIREMEARRRPDDKETKKEAEQARQQAQETCDEVNDVAEDEPVAFQPSPDLKKIYRQAAQLIHPDRAKDEEDRQLRNRLMVEVNAAYTKGDGETIHGLIDRYKHQLDTEDTDDIGSRLIRAIRNIARTRESIAGLMRAIEEMSQSEWAKLKAEVGEGESNGQDPLGALAEKIHSDIRIEQNKLNELLKCVDEQTKQAEAVLKQVEKPPAMKDSMFRPEGLLHRTERGEKVRSKSEAIIANILHNLSLDYRYEYPIEGETPPGIRRPDFVFFDKAGKPLLWEHLGMLNDPDYQIRWNKKLEWYRGNGFVDGKNLFITQDEADGGLDSQHLRKIAEIIRMLVAL